MNKIPCLISCINAYQSCSLIQAQSDIGILHIALLDSQDFSLGQKISVSFKENDVMLCALDNAVISTPNCFEASIYDTQSNDLFTRIALQTPTDSQSHIIIHALLPNISLKDFSLDKGTPCKWFVSPSQMILEY
ncbi:hypothetical protein LS68_008460 [Helicobacter sp. MIT 05-5293]|uniref:hypothetical protein n=1 Tax=Helicobacter sp. MIT 05-5293 TaxID=1548149 RepID=UPI00051DA970|nr:hypothetical protein [Helicobacter sp. MIT 05-5293]TLD80236.1 hypothetical protein LS68_008460 [Helicobacter sp. MIT 05-5293]